MKSKLSSKQYAAIICGEEVVQLTLLPLTFMRLIDVNNALKDEDLNQALQRPTPMNIAKIAYCLLDEKSLSLLESFQIVLDDKFESTNPMHKLYCMICDNNVHDGFTNYTSLLTAITTVVKDSLPEETQGKKKAPRLPRLSTWKKYLT